MAIFNDTTLQEKHKQHLDKLQWDASLGGRKRCHFISAMRDLQNMGVHLPDRSIKLTPHHFFVDDNIYGDILDSYRIRQVVAASIKAIYILLEESDLSIRQDPILFDKLEDMPISYSSHILGQIINTR